MAVRQIIMNISEKVLLAEKADESSFARELRLLAAIKLYELGRLSSGRAAELAGIPRVEFLLELGRYKVFPFEAELRDLERERERACPKPLATRLPYEGITELRSDSRTRKVSKARRLFCRLAATLHSVKSGETRRNQLISTRTFI